MSLPTENKSLALLSEVNRVNLLPELIAQLNKDAGLSGLELNLGSTLEPGEIVNALSEFIAALMERDFNAYLNFLYRVDLPEQAMRIHEGQKMEQVIQDSTLKVLSREWQKVWFKNQGTDQK